MNQFRFSASDERLKQLLDTAVYIIVEEDLRKTDPDMRTLVLLAQEGGAGQQDGYEIDLFLKKGASTVELAIVSYTEPGEESQGVFTTAELFDAFEAELRRQSVSDPRRQAIATELLELFVSSGMRPSKG